MKTSQLITRLQNLLESHGDREILVTWESTVHEITPEAVCLDPDGLVYIDADAGTLRLEDLKKLRGEST